MHNTHLVMKNSTFGEMSDLYEISKEHTAKLWHKTNNYSNVILKLILISNKG